MNANVGEGMCAFFESHKGLKYIFFGGKGGVGKTAFAGATPGRARERGCCQGEGTGGLAAEKGQGVQRFGALAVEVGQVGAGGGQFAPGLGGVKLRDGPGLVTGLENAEGVLAQLHVAAQGGDFGVEGAQQIIIDGDVGGQGEEDVLGVGDGGLGLGGGGLKGAADAAPEVNLVAQVQGDVVGVHIDRL